MKLNARIRNILSTKRMSQTELSRQTGISRHTLNSFLAGRRDDIRATSFVRILDCLGISVEMEMRKVVEPDLDVQKSIGTDLERAISNMSDLQKYTVLETVISLAKSSGQIQARTITNLENYKHNILLERRRKWTIG